MDQRESPQQTPAFYDQFIFDNDAKVTQLEKIVFSTNNTGLTGYLYEKKNQPLTLLPNIHQNNLN